jgi:hypothetical protein
MSVFRLLPFSLLDSLWAIAAAGLLAGGASDSSPAAHLTLAPLGAGESRTPPHVLDQQDDHRSDFPASVTITILPDLAPPAPKVGALRLAAAELSATRRQEAAARIEAGLTPEMQGNFELFVYVSKADGGLLGQRMLVFEKQTSCDLKLVHAWPASTGREQPERNKRGRLVITATPNGYYELDPARMYRRYRSASWDQDMPNAMFFNWERRGAQTGLAIHAAPDQDIAKLGSRASGGCVHLAPENAAVLFEMIRARYRGPVPRLAYDPQTGTMSNRGRFMRDSQGRLKMADGYRVLVMVEDYGGEKIASALL